ncbi:Maintenance of telomere capping protein 6 [Erysiphe necator]|nr:Maintenance of telomere capping protein 6 [Erysiphe necator]
MIENHLRITAEAQHKPSTLFLSERDLSLTVPINFVANPGVSVTSACFSNKKYIDKDFSSCLWNLLEVGFRRLEIDIYWDEGNSQYSLCPATFSKSSLDPEITATPTLSITSVGTTSLVSATSFSNPDVVHQLTPRVRRDTASTSASLQPDIINTLEQNVQILGPYACTESLNLELLLTQLLKYLRKTDNVLEAHLIFVILNLHASAFVNSTDLIQPKPKAFPNYQKLVGHTLSSNFSSYLYTPSHLRSDRANLNESWYKVTSRYKTSSDYYLQDVDKNGAFYSEDGWPAESYIEFALGKRILLGWGSVDSQMSGYNFSGDSEIIFPSDYLKNKNTNLSVTSTGEITEGCFLHNETQMISSINSSWAIEPEFSNFNYPTSKSDDLSSFLHLTSNINNCGISPFLYNNLLNSSAKDLQPYRAYINSTSWSWAPNEPRSDSISTLDNGTNSYRRCATAHLALSGRWTVADCLQNIFSACRAHGHPYKWLISSRATTFDLAHNSCPQGYIFAAPRTALENAYLNQELSRSERNWVGDVKCWVAFESRDVDGCWVVGGKNNTCPYADNRTTLETIRKRTLLIPTVAAIVILVLTALTILAKAARNRREGRRLRRQQSVAYEGVPR